MPPHAAKAQPDPTRAANTEKAVVVAKPSGIHHKKTETKTRRIYIRRVSLGCNRRDTSHLDAARFNQIPLVSSVRGMLLRKRGTSLSRLQAALHTRADQ